MSFFSNLWFFVSLILGGGLLVGIALLVRREIQFHRHIREREDKMKSRLYELAILKELQERFGYSLNLEKIVDIISGSLRQFIDFTLVSYILIEPDRLFLKSHLEESVSDGFVDEVKQRMLDSLKALLGDEVLALRREEMVTGAIMTDELKSSVRSFFNIPLAIKDRIMGVLTIASLKEGLYQEEQMTIIYKIVKQASYAVQKLEDVLAVEQEKMSAMVASMPEGVFMVDTGYGIVVANPEVRRIFDWPAEKEPTIFDFVDALSGRVDIRGKMEESVKFDKLIAIPEVYLGSRFYQIFISPVNSLQGHDRRNFGAVVLFHDVTSEKEIERLRQDFTSMMVHELRSPLDGIHKMTSLLQKKAAKRTEEKEMLDLVYTSSGEMLTLVSDLLDVAKIEAGKFSVLKEDKDLNGVLQEKIEYFQSVHPDIPLEYLNTLPPTQTICSFDDIRMRQVITNLLSNAFKFTRLRDGNSASADSARVRMVPGGVVGTPDPPKVTLSLFEHERGASIALEAKNKKIPWFPSQNSYETLPRSFVVGVTDRGIGIAAERLGELFNKFKQLTAKTRDRGSGLGLIIAKGIVEAHGGVIGVGSEEGQGSTFFFTIPIS